MTINKEQIKALNNAKPLVKGTTLITYTVLPNSDL